MKKLILFICIAGCILSFVLIKDIQSKGLNEKFMITAKIGTSYNIDKSINRPVSLGSQIDYFVNNQTLIGLNFNYLKYYEPVYIGIPDYLGAKDDFKLKYEWYSLTASAKFLFSQKRFTPFVKLGIGLYIPKEIYTHPIEGNLIGTDRVYGKTCPGYNIGMGVQYRVWKLFSLQIEGTINHIFNKAKNISSARYFTFANLESGLSIIF